MSAPSILDIAAAWERGYMDNYRHDTGVTHDDRLDVAFSAAARRASGVVTVDAATLRHAVTTSRSSAPWLDAGIRLANSGDLTVTPR